MTLDRILDVIAIIFGGGGILSFVLNARRTKAQNTLDLSSAWEKFAAPLMQRVNDLEVQTSAQDKEIHDLNAKVTDQEIEIEDLRGWAERLVKQIIELGGVPVSFVKRKNSKVE